MVILIAGGSLSTGSHDPYCGTLMPLGPSTPSVGVDFPEFVVGGSHFHAGRRLTRGGDSIFTLDFAKAIPNAGISFASAAKCAATGAILLRSRLPGRTSASCSRACPC